MHPGEAVGTYLLEGVLGEGSVGTVYRARHALTGQVAAAKVLSPSASADPGAIERCFAEIETAQRLRHPGIAVVRESGQTEDGRSYIVSELCDGETLAQRLARAPTPMPLDEVIQIVRQLASVLASAHTRELPHLALKPENIFLVPDAKMPGGRRVKVVDFGTFRLREGRAVAQTTSDANHIAPEQCLGGQRLDGRTDLYALGSICFLMLTGKPLFGGLPEDIASAHVRSRPSLLRDRGVTVPVELEQLMQRLLEKSADRRPKLATELLEEINLVAFEGRLDSESGPLEDATIAEEVVDASAPPSVAPTLIDEISEEDEGVLPTQPADPRDLAAAPLVEAELLAFEEDSDAMTSAAQLRAGGKRGNAGPVAADADPTIAGKRRVMGDSNVSPATEAVAAPGLAAAPSPQEGFGPPGQVATLFGPPPASSTAPSVSATAGFADGSSGDLPGGASLQPVAVGEGTTPEELQANSDSVSFGPPQPQLSGSLPETPGPDAFPVDSAGSPPPGGPVGSAGSGASVGNGGEQGALQPKLGMDPGFAQGGGPGPYSGAYPGHTPGVGMPQPYAMPYGAAGTPSGRTGGGGRVLVIILLALLFAVGGAAGLYFWGPEYLGISFGDDEVAEESADETEAADDKSAADEPGTKKDPAGDEPDEAVAAAGSATPDAGSSNAAAGDTEGGAPEVEPAADGGIAGDAAVVDGTSADESDLPAVVVYHTIESTPRGATVYRNDKKVGSTPYRASFEAGEGEVRFRLRKRGYQDEEFLMPTHRSAHRSFTLLREGEIRSTKSPKPASEPGDRGELERESAADSDDDEARAKKERRERRRRRRRRARDRDDSFGEGFVDPDEVEDERPRRRRRRGDVEDEDDDDEFEEGFVEVP